MAEPQTGSELRVSQLIAAAQKHLNQFGDDLVGVVVESFDRKTFLHIEPATKTGYDTYEVDGPQYFEVECVVTENE